jgi:D-alanyl-D-alanine carboxypeptidase
MILIAHTYEVLYISNIWELSYLRTARNNWAKEVGVYIGILAMALLGQDLTLDQRKQIEARGAQYVSALNAVERAEREKILGSVFSADVLAKVGVEKLAGQAEALQKHLKKAELHHAELVEMRIGPRISRILHVYVRASEGQPWRDLQMRVEDAAPFKLSQLAFVAEVAEPVFLPNGDIQDPSTLEWMKGYIDRLVADSGLSGAVLIATGSTPFFERYFGFADAAQRRAITRETQFGMASGSKMFTALAAAQLVEQKKLSFDDPLVKFFPDWPDQEFARKVTLHHLLSHTSGLREYWTEDFHKVRHTIRETAGLLPWIHKAGVASEPGTRAEYSNSNFALAGLIVEKAAGKDFYAKIQADLIARVGMNSTGYPARKADDVRQAEPLVRAGAGWAALAADGGRGTAAGGAATTATDMLKFAQALVQGRIVQKATLQRMTTPQPGREPSSLRYGYGFELETQGNVSSYGHGGQATGANFAFRYFPQRDLTLVVMSNQDNGAFDDLQKNLVKLVTGYR